MPNTLEAELRKTQFLGSSPVREQGIQQLKHSGVWNKNHNSRNRIHKFGQEVQKQFNKERTVFPTDDN